MKKWQLLDSKMAFDNRWFKVRQDKVKLPNGKTLDDYFVWLKGDVAMMVPVTENKELIFVKQYKHAARKIMIEYPAGFVEKGEKPLETAKRELMEEIGCSADLSLVAQVEDEPTKAEGTIYIYLAQNLKPVKKTSSDDNEEIEILKISFKETLEMIDRGEIWANETIAATFLAFKKLDVLKNLL